MVNNSLDANVFAEDEILPAAIIVDAYLNNDMQGMKNARYFSTVVANCRLGGQSRHNDLLILCPR